MNKQLFLIVFVGFIGLTTITSCADSEASSGQPVTLWKKPASASGMAAQVPVGEYLAVEGPFADENGNSLNWYKASLSNAYIDEQYIDTSDCQVIDHKNYCKVID